METLESKRWQLRRRAESLQGEFDKWRQASKRGRDFQKHHTQILAFTGLLTDIQEQLEELAEEDLTPRDVRELTGMVLGAYRIWEFLRTKLVQRREPSFVEFLQLADEFAWHCYQPVYRQGFKEPPLVFLNGGYSPFILVRNLNFQAEFVPQELIQDQTLLEAMSSLPFPVIGVPWYQVRSLADLTVLAHEVGHTVEADLGLNGPLDELLKKQVQDGQRQALWLSWRCEAFADLYGCASAGPAFVHALADFLSTEDGEAAPEGYPPSAVRFALNLAALKELGFGEAVEKLSERWGTFYKAADGQAELIDDAESAAKALLSERLEPLKGSLREAIQFSSNQEKQARSIADNVVQRFPIGHGYDLITLSAAYRYAYDKILEKNSWDSVPTDVLGELREAMLRTLTNELRSGELPRTAEDLEKNPWLKGQSAVWLQQLKKAQS